MTTDELHLALQKCREIKSSWTLYEFLYSLANRFGNGFPSKDSFSKIERDDKLRKLCKSVIICTTFNYKDS